MIGTNKPQHHIKLTTAVLSVLAVLVWLPITQGVTPGFLTIKDGYFYDPGLGEYWYAKGIAYQDWNIDLGEWQTYEQIEYDLREIKKIGANSLRVDFVWKAIEVEDNVFEWDRYDFLVATAEKLDLKIFALVGYQWPPSWFPGTMFEEGNNVDPGYYTMHPPGPEVEPPFVPPKYNYTQKWVSDIMSFENPGGRAQYQEFLKAVGERYKDRTGIGAWIVGNEFGYIGLWSYRQDGYDPYCEAAFRTWLAKQYNNNIASANSVWKTNFASFSAVSMPLGYNRDNKLWADLILWRQQSLGGFLASGAAAIRSTDPNHMLSYATVGMIWGPEDWRYFAEDTGVIAQSCVAAGAPLSFMSINNYPNGMSGDELRSGKWGFRYAKWKMDLPVMLTEVGYTATENLFPVYTTQGVLLRNALWESVIGCGAIGIHVFTWPYRPWVTVREQGFGIVSANRVPSVYVADVKLVFSLIDQHKFVTKYWPKSVDNKADIAFYWPDSVKQMYNRYQENMQEIFGPLERLGFQPRFMNRAQLLAGEYKQVKALILPRNQRLEVGDLQFIRENVLGSGVHVYADADLPGMQTYYIEPQTDFTSEMLNIFGIEVIEANAFEDSVVEYQYGTTYQRVDARALVNFGTTVTAGQTDIFWTWKYHKLSNVNAQQISSITLQVEGWQNEYPGLLIKKHPNATAAISSFAMGALSPSGVAPWELPDQIPWNIHWKWFHALLTSPQGFGITPSLVTTGSPFVMPDSRTSGDDEVVFGTITNWSDKTTEKVTVTFPEFVGKTIVDALTNELLAVNSRHGNVSATLAHNEMMVLKAYKGSAVASILITDYPSEVTPINATYNVVVSYNTASNPTTKTNLRVQFATTSGLIYGSTVVPLTSKVGVVTIPVYIYSRAAANTKEYISSDNGGSFEWRAALIHTTGGTVVSTNVPVLLSFGIKPVVLPSPTAVKPGAKIKTTLQFENLLSLARAHAFPGRVLVYYSSKTAKVDWAHGEKVGAVVDWLQSMGYQFGYLGPYTEKLKMDGPVYFMLSDDMLCNYSLCGTNGVADATLNGQLYNLNAYYISTYFQVIILPGVWVMNDVETENLKYFLQNVPDSKVIATEGGVGRLKEDGVTNGESRLASVFGMGPTPAFALQDYHAALTVQSNIDHLITRDYYYATTNKTANPNPIAVTSRIGNSWVWPQVLPTALQLGSLNVQGDPTTHPALVVNQYSTNGTTFLLNVDASLYLQMNTTLKNITSGLNDWFVLGQYVNKFEWRVVCASSSTSTSTEIASVSDWILTPSDSKIVKLTIPSVMVSCATTHIHFEGFVYPWMKGTSEATAFASRIAYYSTVDRQP